ncbi:MAG TPA: Hsp20/alpha crystallin family protein [Planctomycetota bacterium]|nr:Hsp20/alpha crystallin family protein [Planctomycetota bacterium]
MKTLPALAPNRTPATWDPFSAFSDMRRHMDEFMQGVLGQHRSGVSSWRPAIDVDEDERSFTIRIEVPGWEEKDVTVEVDQNILTVRGHRGSDGTHSTTGASQPTTRWSGSFIQSLSLPPTIDAEHITAQLERGLLTMHLPKQPTAAPKRIPVTQAGAAGGREPAGG